MYNIYIFKNAIVHFTLQDYKSIDSFCQLCSIVEIHLLRLIYKACSVHFFTSMISYKADESFVLYVHRNLIQ
jgi:hypothetical protein